MLGNFMGIVGIGKKLVGAQVAKWSYLLTGTT